MCHCIIRDINGYDYGYRYFMFQPLSDLIKGEVQFFINNGFPLVFDDRRSAKSPKRNKTANYEVSSGAKN